MALNSFVYIRNVDNLSDARYSAGMGVDLVGFKLDPHDESSLKSEQFKEISEWISGIKIVGEFGNSGPYEVNELLHQFEVDYILISEESQIQDFIRLGKPLILAVHINGKTKNELIRTFNRCSGLIELFLVESEQEHPDEDECNFIRQYSSRYPIILGYGVNTKNAKTIVDELNIKGISLKGGTEIRPGYKDFDELAGILEALEID